MIRKPSAFVPLVLSAAALGLIVGFLLIFGVVHQEDEGAAARLFQLIMLAQLPIIAFFGLRWVPTAPRQGVPILLLQLLAAVVPIAVVVALE